MRQMLDGDAAVLPEIAKAMEGRIEEVLSEQRTSENIQIAVGQPPFRTFLATVFPLSGGSDAAAVVLRDITEYKSLEDAVRQSRRAEMIERLAGGVAHDYNNLLTSILGNASLLAEAVAEGRSIRGMVDDIIQASERAAELTRQLLAYAGKAAFVRERIILSELIRNRYSDLRPLISANITLRMVLAPHVPPIEADATQLAHLVEILVRNAVEAIGAERSGTIALRVFQKQSTEEERGASKPDLCLEVIDDGCGMEESVLSKAFEPFFTTKFPGRGLGLAAAQVAATVNSRKVSYPPVSICRLTTASFLESNRDSILVELT